MSLLSKSCFFVPLAICVAVLSWYLYYDSSPSLDTLSPEEAVKLHLVLRRFLAWGQIIKGKVFTKPRKFYIGTNANLDLIVSFDQLKTQYNFEEKLSPTAKAVIHSFEDFLQTFSYYFSRGAAAERFISQKDVFENLTTSAQNVEHRLYIGGNAALMAEFLAGLKHTQVELHGPIGRQLRPLMSYSLFEDVPTSATDRSDEIHLIIEYKTGEKLFENAAPVSNRFIVHHDITNSELIDAHHFLKTATDPSQQLDWAVWSGLHFLDNLSTDGYMPHLELFNSIVKDRQSSSPLHLELASMANKEFVSHLFELIVPYVDSIGLNDQELMFFTNVLQNQEVEPTKSVDEVIGAMVWILEHARKTANTERHLTRIHMHAHSFHAIAISKGEKWFGSAAALVHGAFAAAIRACRSQDAMLFDLSEPTFSNGTVLSYVEDGHPVIHWTELDGKIQIFAIPTVFCRKPVGTVGLGDAISSAALLYNSMDEKLAEMKV